MKILKLLIDLEGLNLSDNDKKMSAIEISTKVIQNVISTYSNQVKGLSKSERNQYYTIKALFEKAVKDSLVEIDIEDNDIGFIRKCFRESRLNPNDLLKRVEDNVDSIKDR